MSKLTNCKDCGHQISKKAASCPNCGAKVKRTPFIVWFAGIGIAIAFLISAFNPPTKNSSTAAEVDDVSPSETLEVFEFYKPSFDKHAGAMVYITKELVTDMMRDPESAEFRKMSYIKAAPDLPATVCGEVTAKNGFNGYTGYKKFLMKTDNSQFGIEGSMDNFFDEYNKYCVLQ